MVVDKKIHEYFSEIFRRQQEVMDQYREGLITGPEAVNAMLIALDNGRDVCTLVSSYNNQATEILDRLRK